MTQLSVLCVVTCLDVDWVFEISMVLAWTGYLDLFNSNLNEWMPTVGREKYRPDNTSKSPSTAQPEQITMVFHRKNKTKLDEDLFWIVPNFLPDDPIAQVTELNNSNIVCMLFFKVSTSTWPTDFSPVNGAFGVLGETDYCFCYFRVAWLSAAFFSGTDKINCLCGH